MDLDFYQLEAHKTSKECTIGGFLLPYAAMGLAGETGELLNKIKKIYRDQEGIITDGVSQQLQAELGDTLWYVAEIATILGLNLSDIAQENIDTLRSRKERGKIGGSGDDR